jgi:protein-S-isoprenylcysteine O-methyltransferase Ste14
MPIVLTIFGLVWRLFDEEAFLEKNLSGYTEYCAKIRWVRRAKARQKLFNDTSVS